MQIKFIKELKQLNLQKKLKQLYLPEEKLEHMKYMKVI